jgi:hypothetical protein
MIPDKGAAINGSSSGYYDLSTLQRAHKESYIKNTSFLPIRNATCHNLNKKSVHLSAELPS